MMFSKGAAQFGQYGQAGRSFMQNSGYFHSAPRMFMMVGCILAVIIIAAVIIIIVKKAHKKHRYSDAMELLNIRYVKGELTDEEYLRMKNVIKNS
jgi:putative membrane protein